MACQAKEKIGSLSIGTSVYGDYQVDLLYLGKGTTMERILDRVPLPFKGVLVGARYVPIGKKIYIGPEEGWRFEVTKKVFVFIVRESFLGREILVLPEDMKVKVNGSYNIPILKQSWPKEARESLSKEMSGWPRDKKGRWTSIKTPSKRIKEQR